MNPFATRTLPALALLVALALPSALASGPVHVDAAAAPFADGGDALGVDLVWDGDLTLVLAAEGVGALGNAIVPVVDTDGWPTDALGRVHPDEATVRSGVVVTTPGGVNFMLEGGNALNAAATTTERLEALGFDVEATNDGRILTFGRDGRTFRATFAVHDAGIQVYVGEL